MTVRLDEAALAGIFAYGVGRLPASAVSRRRRQARSQAHLAPIRRLVELTLKLIDEGFFFFSEAPRLPARRSKHRRAVPRRRLGRATKQPGGCRRAVPLGAWRGVRAVAFKSETKGPDARHARSGTARRRPFG